MSDLCEDVLEYVTGCGNNPLVLAVLYAEDVDESICEARAMCWEFAGNPTDSELRDAFEVVAKKLRAELERG